MIPGIIPGMTGQTGPVLTYLGSALNASSSNIYNFSSQPLGNPSPTRVIVAAFSGVLGATFSYSSSTLAGISGSYINLSYVVSGSANISTVMSQAVVPTDTTGTIQVVWNKSIARCAMSLWAIDGLQSTTFNSTNFSAIIGSGALDLSLNTQINDVIIAATTAFNNNSATWVGLTENYDDVFGTSRNSAASAIATSTETPRTITATIGGTSAGVSALWR